MSVFVDNFGDVINNNLSFQKRPNNMFSFKRKKSGSPKKNSSRKSSLKSNKNKDIVFDTYTKTSPNKTSALHPSLNIKLFKEFMQKILNPKTESDYENLFALISLNIILLSIVFNAFKPNEHNSGGMPSFSGMLNQATNVLENYKICIKSVVLIITVVVLLSVALYWQTTFWGVTGVTMLKTILNSIGNSILQYFMPMSVTSFRSVFAFMGDSSSVVSETTSNIFKVIYDVMKQIFDNIVTPYFNGVDMLQSTLFVDHYNYIFNALVNFDFSAIFSGGASGAVAVDPTILAESQVNSIFSNFIGQTVNYGMTGWGLAGAKTYIITLKYLFIETLLLIVDCIDDCKKSLNKELNKPGTTEEYKSSFRRSIQFIVDAKDYIANLLYTLRHPEIIIKQIKDVIDSLKQIPEQIRFILSLRLSDLMEEALIPQPNETTEQKNKKKEINKKLKELIKKRNDLSEAELKNLHSSRAERQRKTRNVDRIRELQLARENRERREEFKRKEQEEEIKKMEEEAKLKQEMLKMESLPQEKSHTISFVSSLFRQVQSNIRSVCFDPDCFSLTDLQIDPTDIQFNF